MYTYYMKKIIIIAMAILISSNTSISAASTKINNKNNKDSCTQIMSKYKSSVMSEWSKGLASDDDLIKETNNNILVLSSRANKSSGQIKNSIRSWVKAEKQIKDNIVNEDIPAILIAFNLKVSSLEKFIKSCSLISK
jgi:hypothetical protein